MSKWAEFTADELFFGGSRVLWIGLTETTTEFKIDLTNPNRGLVIKTNSQGKTLWQREVVGGSHCYRITTGGVRRLPVIEKDPDAVRRLARTLGWPFTKIVSLGDGEVFTYSPRCQGDNGEYKLSEGQDVAIATLWTGGNPEMVTRIFVRKNSFPSWEEVEMVLRNKASSCSDDQLLSFEEAVKIMRFPRRR